jgi:hypothetical protein
MTISRHSRPLAARRIVDLAGIMPWRFGRRLRNGISGAFKRGPEQQGLSARDTRPFMHFMADATGGKVCVANDENTGRTAVHAIAGQVLNAPGRDQQSASDSECLSWGVDLSQN